MAWAVHAMRGRRLACQAGAVGRRRRLWSLRSRLTHWMAVLRWDSCAGAFAAARARAEARRLAACFAAWRRARLVAESLPAALAQLVFSAWVCYTRGRRGKRRALGRAGAHLLAARGGAALRRWREWGRDRGRRRDSRDRDGGGDRGGDGGRGGGWGHYLATRARRHLLYWLYWAWWRGRAVLFSRRRGTLSGSGSVGSGSGSGGGGRANATPYRGSSSTSASAAHNGHSNSNSNSNSNISSNSNGHSNSNSSSNSNSNISSSSGVAPRRIVFSAHPHSAMKATTTATTTSASTAAANATATTTTTTRARPTPFRELAAMRLPYLAPRAAARGGGRRVPGVSESLSRRALRHWAR
jgi:hypothetical protein